MPPAPTLSFTDKMRLFMEWLPALQTLPLIAAAKPGRDRALEVVRQFEIVSAKTAGTTDDELTKLVKETLLTDAGGRLIEYATEKVRSLANANA